MSEMHATHALYRAIIRGPLSVEQLSRRSGIKAPRLYKLAEGRTNIKRHEIGALYRATGDVDLVATLIDADDVGLNVVPKAQPAPHTKGLEHGALSTGVHAGEVQRLVLAALEDGRVDCTEKADILAAARVLRRAAAQLELMLVEDERVVA